MSRGGRTFRLAGCPGDGNAALELLRAEGYEYREDAFWERAFVSVSEPKALGSSLAAAFGLIYIQDRSSMLPPLMLDPEPGSAVVDLCASPGGKSGIAAMLAGPGGYVLANEPNPKRLATLRRNLTALCSANVGTCSAPGEEISLAEGSFGNIILDPPCSGWGTEEKNPQVTTLWKGDRIDPLIQLQRRLLRRAAGLLAPGGRLMYSTCTTNHDENEAQVRFAMDELGLTLLPLKAPAGVELDDPTDPACAGCMRVVKGESGGQGFFLALMTRDSSYEVPPATDHEPPGRPLTEAEREAMAFCDLTRLPPGDIRVFGETCVMIHEQSALLPLGFRWQGLPLGRIKGGRFHVEPRARVLVPMGPDAKLLDVDEPEPLQRLLSGQGLAVDAKKGFMGLAFRGVPLGWLAVKNGRALWTAKG